MNKIKEKKLGIRVNYAIMIGLMIFGFSYPNLFKNTLDDILWNGKDGDIFFFGLFGVFVFELSGVAATGVIKYLINDKMKKSFSSVIIFDFFVFGVSYMALSIMSAIESYGIIGKAAIEYAHLEMVKPLAIILLCSSIIGLIAAAFKLYNCYFKKNNAGSDGKIVAKKKTDFGEMNKLDDEVMNTFFGNTERCENKKQDNVEKDKDDKTEKSAVMTEIVSSSRLKSTIKTTATETSVEENDRFKPAGDL